MIAEKDFWLHISMRAKNLIVFLMTLYVSGIEIRSTVCQEAELPGYQRMDLAGTTRDLSAANAVRPLQPIEREDASSPIRDHETTKLQEAAPRHGDDAGPSRKYEPIPLRNRRAGRSELPWIHVRARGCRSKHGSRFGPGVGPFPWGGVVCEKSSTSVACDVAHWSC